MPTIRLLLLLLVTFDSALAASPLPDTRRVDAFSAEVLDTEAHNPNWFTQGLYREADGFFISSGLYGRSQLIYQSAKSKRTYSLPARYFAEGLTVIGDKLFLLTWKENTLFIFDKNSFKKIGSHRYRGEGWGLTHRQDTLIMSNGSNQLSFRDQKDFRVIKTLTVKGLNKLNELEYIDGIIWANRWYDDNIYAIDSETGCLLASINLQPLRKQATTADIDHVTNGIAYDNVRRGLWVTGKYWSQRFLIKLPDINPRSC